MEEKETVNKYNLSRLELIKKVNELNQEIKNYNQKRKEEWEKIYCRQ